MRLNPKTKRSEKSHPIQRINKRENCFLKVLALFSNHRTQQSERCFPEKHVSSLPSNKIKRGNKVLKFEEKPPKIGNCNSMDVNNAFLCGDTGGYLYEDYSTVHKKHGGQQSLHGLEGS